MHPHLNGSQYILEMCGYLQQGEGSTTCEDKEGPVWLHLHYTIVI